MANAIFTTAFMVMLFTLFVCNGKWSDLDLIVTIPVPMLVIGTLIGLGSFISSFVED